MKTWPSLIILNIADHITYKPPGWVAPKDMSICSIVGWTCGELKWTPLNEDSKLKKEISINNVHKVRHSWPAVEIPQKICIEQDTHKVYNPFSKG